MADESAEIFILEDEKRRMSSDSTEEKSQKKQSDAGPRTSEKFRGWRRQLPLKRKSGTKERKSVVNLFREQ